MERADFNEEIRQRMDALVGKWLPGNVYEELINYLCGKSKITLHYTPYEEMRRLEIMVRHYLEDTSVRRTVVLEGYDIYRLEAVKRIYVALYNIINSFKMIEYLDKLAPERGVENVTMDLYDMAAEQLLNGYMVNDGYILLKNGNDTYFDHLKVHRLLDMNLNNSDDEAEKISYEIEAGEERYDGMYCRDNHDGGA